MKSVNHSSTEKKSDLEIYKSLVNLKQDLYYKDIISAHESILVKKTQDAIDDIFHCYKQKYISKNDMFTQIEELKCKNHIIDQVVYKNISFARAEFCKKPTNVGKRNTSYTKS